MEYLDGFRRHRHHGYGNHVEMFSYATPRDSATNSPLHSVVSVLVPPACRLATEAEATGRIAVLSVDAELTYYMLVGKTEIQAYRLLRLMY